jgi:hypothetical protein
LKINLKINENIIWKQIEQGEDSLTQLKAAISISSEGKIAQNIKN